MYAGGGAAIYNYGLWIAQDDQQLNNYSGGAGTVFNNFGTFRKSGGISAGNTLFGNPVNFTNTGVLDVQKGNLVFQGNNSFTGGYITTNGTGKTYFDAGNFNLNGMATGTNVFESAGNLVGTNVINGALTWQDGTVEQHGGHRARHQRGEHHHREQSLYRLVASSPIPAP